ncbi:MAG: hypothetical protein JNM76_04445 [Betaproteobacteria bacterium]|nr:hypothetical protein [Betaproteobacteria bacterium]
MNRKQISESLTLAIAGRSIARITRKVEPGFATGYVVASNEHWVVLLVVDDAIFYSGFQAFRIQDIATVSVPSPHASFYHAVLRKRSPKRPRLPQISIESTQALLASVGKRFPLVTIHREIADPDVCNIGRLVEVTGRAASLLEVTPDATWEQEVTQYRLTEITRVDFGGPYEEALALVAGC